MIQIEVTYYAMLRERRGLSAESIQTEAASLGALYDDLAGEFGLPNKRQHLKVAVNDQFVSWDSSFAPGDRITFIPPVSGG